MRNEKNSRGDAYDDVDRFLRGVLDDASYERFGAYLEAVYALPDQHEKAVEALIADGWTWDGAQWVRPHA